MANITKIKSMESVIFIIIFIFSMFLRFYRIGELMPFIGDQGWFYISARDMLLTGNIPLVGITSSHTWLHQGPYWTYILGFLLYLGRFNVIFPGIFTAVMGSATIVFLYIFMSKMFSKREALISSLFFASSPLAIIHSRMPYHTSLIPLFSLLFFYFVYKWIKGSTKFFILSILVLSILYNFELATQVFWFLFLLILFVGIIKKKKYAISLLKIKTILLSIVFLIVPMFPVIIYDFNNDFPQTVKFALWIPYKMISFLTIHSSTVEFSSILNFFAIYTSRIVFLQNYIGATIILIFPLFWLIKMQVNKKLNDKLILLSLFILVPLAGLFISGTSEAYLPMIYPFLFILFGIVFFDLMKKKLGNIIVFFIIFICLSNAYYLISGDYLMGKRIGYGPLLSEREKIAKSLISQAGSKKYDLIGKGPGSQYKSFTMNYEYLLWLEGKEPSVENEKLKFAVSESNVSIKLERISE